MGYLYIPDSTEQYSTPVNLYIVLPLRKICSTILSRDNSGYVVAQLNDPKSDLIGCPVYQAVIFVYPTVIPYHYGDNTAYSILS